MRITFTCIIILLSFSFCKAKDFDMIRVKEIAKAINWKPVNYLKYLTGDKLDLFFLQYNNNYAEVKQLNIEGWAVCEYEKIDNLQLYNYYYSDISRETYNLYCQEINALMLLDGIIKQRK